MNQTTVVVATFVAQHQLSVTTNGSGLVTSSPGGINCGPTCSFVYDQGTAVTLTPSSRGRVELRRLERARVSGNR